MLYFLNAQNLFSKKFRGTVISRFSIGATYSEMPIICIQKTRSIVLMNNPVMEYDAYVRISEPIPRAPNTKRLFHQYDHRTLSVKEIACAIR